MRIRTVRQRNGEAGNALVEFALSMVVILTMLFGIIDVGRALFAYDWVSNAARLGTRFAVVRGATCTQLSGGCPAIQSDVINYINGNAAGINTSEVTIHTHCIVGETSFGLLPCAPGTSVYVQVQYSFQFITPLVPFHSWLMTSSSQMVVSR
jgi:Flp pilus assembly protein TadG